MAQSHTRKDTNNENHHRNDDDEDFKHERSPAGLKEYFQEVHNNPNMSLEERMKFGIIRFSTFSTYPKSDISCTILSRAGFYYEGIGDEVKCFRCGLKWKNWHKNDNPLRIHKDNSTDCAHINFVLQRNNRTSALIAQETMNPDIDLQTTVRCVGSRNGRVPESPLNNENTPNTPDETRRCLQRVSIHQCKGNHFLHGALNGTILENENEKQISVSVKIYVFIKGDHKRMLGVFNLM